MIVSREEMPVRPIEIDLNGPEGNAHVLMGYARRLGRQLGFSNNKIEGIIKVMMLTNYEGLLHTFDLYFGDYVIMYR